MKITEPGIYPEMTAEQYFAGAAPTRTLTNSGIKTLTNETPADYIGSEDKQSAAMRKGDVTHQLALDKGKGYVISPYDEYRTNEAKAWRDAAIGEGLTPVKKKDFDDASEMAKIIKTRIVASLDGADYLTEVPFFWTEETPHGVVWCSGMMDVWCPDLGVVIDPKVTPYLHQNKARAHINNMGWHTQNAWYRRGLGKLLPELDGRIQFKNLLIKPDKPYTSRLVSISEGWRTGAEADCLRGLGIFAACMASNEWPGYPNEEVLDEPSWAMNERLMREVEENEQ